MRTRVHSHSMNQAIKRLQRRKRGVMGTMLLLMAILVVLAMSLFAIDMAQLVCMRDQLRNAADAGATAGAQDLYTDPDQCEAHAYAVCAKNLAFDLPIQDLDNVMDVVAVKKDKDADFDGKKTVTVDVTMKRKDIIAPIIGRLFDTLHVRAVAGGAGHTIQTYGNAVFPMAVDLNIQPGATNNPWPSLAMAAQNGGTLKLVVQNDPTDNAAWTNLIESKTVSNSLLDDYLELILGDNSHGNNHQKVDTVPPVWIGENIGLKNGHAEVSIDVSKEPWKSILLDPDNSWVLPIVDNGGKMNPQDNVVGFVTLQFTDVLAVNGNTGGSDGSNGNGNGNANGSGTGTSVPTGGNNGNGPNSAADSANGNDNGNAGGNGNGNGNGTTSGTGSGTTSGTASGSSTSGSGSGSTSGNGGATYNGQGFTLTAKILKVCIPGLSGPLPLTGNSYSDSALTEVDPPTIKLIQ